jgi:hypothetical protein
MRSQNHSQVFSEDEKLVFKTPETSSRYKPNGKLINTVRVDKRDKLDLKSSNSVIDGQGKSINLSEILRTTEYEESEYINLLEENISSDLTSLSQYDVDIAKKVQEISKSTQKEETHKTPNFANRVQSKVKQMEDDGEKKGRYLDMSLGDIPEEHEDNCTISENCKMSMDWIMGYHKTLSQAE